MNKTNFSDNLPEKFTQKLSRLKQSLRLGTNEAQEMRERLIAYADLHSTPQTSSAARATVRAIPSPYVASFRFFYSRAFVAGLLIFILIIGTGTSVTYAAGNSLPGQSLYPVKVDVAEPIEGAVIAATSGTTGSATWQNTLAERRITEATTLAAENDLASSTQTYLENQAEIHIAQSNDDSAELAAAGDTTAANQVRSDLDARLAAHAELLALIAPRLAAAGDATTTSQVATLLSAISQDQAAVLFNPDSGEATTTSTTIATVSSSSSASSTTDATTTITIAIANTAPSASFKKQEAGFFAANLHILGLLPQASTTASTSLFIYPKHKHSGTSENDATSTISTVVTTSSTTESDSSSDSPVGADSSAATTLQTGL